MCAHTVVVVVFPGYTVGITCIMYNSGIQCLPRWYTCHVGTHGIRLIIHSLVLVAVAEVDESVSVIYAGNFYVMCTNDFLF